MPSFAKYFTIFTVFFVVLLNLMDLITRKKVAISSQAFLVISANYYDPQWQRSMRKSVNPICFSGLPRSNHRSSTESIPNMQGYQKYSKFHHRLGYLIIFVNLFFILIYQTEEHHVSLLGNLELSQNQQTILAKQGLTNTMNFLDNLIK